MLVEIAKKSTVLSELMSGREKISTSEVAQESKKGGLTLKAVDLIESSEGVYCCAIFREIPDKYYCGGLVLTKIVMSWVDDLGTIDEVNRQLKDEDVRLRFTEQKTKDGARNVTSVEIL